MVKKLEVEIEKAICVHADLSETDYPKLFLKLHNNFRKYSHDGYYAIQNDYGNGIYLYVTEKNKDDLIKYLEAHGAKVVYTEEATVIDYVYLDSDNVVMNQFYKEG